ncbi:hypothetical protein [Phaeovulum sp. W22_SRMD_FR3]|uniref:hypothetical protein n=1 Tax=Phaeovulum sp. W22_SRMD_FR3 TaxID=3240274 RepID=UPI003F989E7C
MAHQTGQPIARITPPSRPLAQLCSRRRVLVIEPILKLPAALRGVTGASVTLITFAELDRFVLERYHPDVVLAPLMTARYDILDVLQRLHELKFRGSLRAIAPTMPNLMMIRSELRAKARGLDFEVLEI